MKDDIKLWYLDIYESTDLDLFYQDIHRGFYILNEHLNLPDGRGYGGLVYGFSYRTGAHDYCLEFHVSNSDVKMRWSPTY